MAELSTPPERIGRYRIERKIGEGGMGVVYAARDERLERPVALKMIRSTGDDTARKRMWREARAVAGVTHPRICQLYEIEESGDDLFMAMELLDGEPLGSRLKHGPLPVADAVSVTLETLDALEALHGHGFVHRDLKPSNVFLTPHGVKLLDFGLARPTASWLAEDTLTQLTQAGAIAGTPNYMAPEQVRGRPLDPRADLFAMATILFEMLSGKQAFTGQTMVDVLHAVLHEQPAALSGSVAVVALDRVIHRALNKRPDDRYATAAAMAMDVRTASQVRDSSEIVTAPARPVTRLIALPFRVLRPDAETDFLAFSLPDAITTSLVGLKALLVRSSAAAARFDPQAPDLRRIATDADVDLVLMGTLLRAGDQLRATAQLVEAPEGTVVWSHSAQLALHDIFKLQDTLVERIVESLSIPLSARESRALKRDVPAHPEAYELYLRANELARDYDRMAEARDLYLRCVELDSGYAPAWARLGRSHRVLGKYLGDPHGVALAEEAFKRALTLNPDLPLAHNLYAQLESDGGRVLDALRRLLRRAKTSSDPELFAGLVHACRYGGLLEASLAAHEEARRLDPHARTSVLNTYSLLGEHERVLGMPEVEDELDSKAYALYRLGRDQEAAALMAQEESGGWPRERFGAALRAFYEGRHDVAGELLEELGRSNEVKDPEGHYYLAMCLSRAGRGEASLRWVKAALADGFFVPPRILAEDPWLAALRDEPGFAEVSKEAAARCQEALAVFRAEGGDKLLGLRAAA